MSKLGIVAALEREVWPLVRQWNQCTVEFRGRSFKIYDNNNAALVCGGIGPEPARRAAEALVAFRQPSILMSVGYAGALVPEVRPGYVFAANRVVDADTKESFESCLGTGTLVTTIRILDASAKAELRQQHNAVAVEMEAAAVAAVAKQQGRPFLAVKSIFDAGTFSLPPLTEFIDSEGHFLTSKYLAYVAVRPWKWPVVYRMARTSVLASARLCDWLRQFLNEAAVEERALGEQAVGPQ
jgi:adenosylhomocysteine nucleosidase